MAATPEGLYLFRTTNCGGSSTIIPESVNINLCSSGVNFDNSERVNDRLYSVRGRTATSTTNQQQHPQQHVLNLNCDEWDSLRLPEESLVRDFGVEPLETTLVSANVSPGWRLLVVAGKILLFIKQRKPNGKWWRGFVPMAHMRCPSISKRLIPGSFGDLDRRKMFTSRTTMLSRVYHVLDMWRYVSHNTLTPLVHVNAYAWINCNDNTYSAMWQNMTNFYLKSAIRSTENTITWRKKFKHRVKWKSIIRKKKRDSCALETYVNNRNVKITIEIWTCQQI